MTAIVGILNRRGAVMAADSAVTVGSGDNTKIYNTATKLFPLSRNNPVGVMIFNSANFMGTPWDLIFKLYRDRKGDQSFYTLEEYAKSFLDYLKSENYFSSIDSQKRYFTSEISSFYYRVKDEITDIISDMDGEGEEDGATDEQVVKVTRNKLSELKGLYSSKGVNPEFEDYSITLLRSYGAEEFQEWADLCKEDGFPEELRPDWEECFFEYIRSLHYYKGTGVVFVGYGNKDIYPSLMTVYLSGAFDHRLRFFYSEEEKDTISNDNTACINPFAQTDVMFTLMQGINPGLERLVHSAYKESVSKTQKKMLDAMKEAGVPDKTIEKVAKTSTEDIEKEFADRLEEYQQENFISGIVDAVDAFNLEDMANMAESLVSVTNLQRHISSSEESVGGPIDVAVITRTEGFFWVKHKQWPPKEGI